MSCPSSTRDLGQRNRDTFTVGRAFMFEAAARLDVSTSPPHLLYDAPGYPTTLRAIAVAAVRRLYVTAGLLEPGSVGEAAVLARSLIESATSSAYIAAAPDPVEREKRSLRYRSYEVVQVYTHLVKSLHVLARYSAVAKVDPTLTAYLEIHRLARDTAVTRFADIEQKFKRGWAGDGFGGMVRDVLATDPKARVGMLVDWYVRFSAFTHSTALSTSLSLTDENSPERRLLAFHVACASVLATLACCLEAARFGPQVVPDLSGLMDRSMVEMCEPSDAESRAALFSAAHWS